MRFLCACSGELRVPTAGSTTGIRHGTWPSLRKDLTMRLGLNGHETERSCKGSAQLGGNIVADRNIISTKDVYHSIQEEINCGK